MNGEPDPSPAPSRVGRLIRFAAGILLLAAAVYAAASHRADALNAWDSIRTANPALIALALFLPIVNLLVTSLSFWVQMRRYGERRVGPGEMSALIAAAWLLNFLPLRPGMFSRLAYHKAVNRISISDSFRALAVGMAFGALAVVAVLGIAWALPPRAGPGALALVLTLPAAFAAAAMLAGSQAGWWWIPAVFLARYADMLVWVLRYWVVFRLVGAPVTFPQSAAIAAVCQLALNIPLFGNGMGLREWAVGLTAARLPAGLFQHSGGVAVPIGLAADLVNRAAELAVAVPLGLGCAAWLAHRTRRNSALPS